MPRDELPMLGTSGGAIAHTILVVEDDADSAEFLRNVLEQNGYKVNVASDGGQAQSTFVMRKPDFVILDLILPGESGFEICERFKQTNSEIPILIVSAIDMVDSRALASRVGADGYLTKPVNSDELLGAISEISQQVWERHHNTGPAEKTRVRFSCRCGKKFKVSSNHRGKSLTCPDCGEPVTVPRHD